MVQCTECGARNSAESTFCVRCGAAMVVRVAAAEVSPGSDTDRIDPVVAEPAADVEPEPVIESTLVMAPTAEQEPPSSEVLLAQAADLIGEGHPDEAAARCREAIQLAPDMVAAYSMLGMAEEQRGNPIAAAGAYRRVLQLDPSRSAERDKLELLYEAGVERHHEPGPERGGDEDRSSPVGRWAPIVAGLAGAFLVMMILTAIILRVNGARAAERTYEESMAAAEASLGEREYAAAVGAFEAALVVRPEDSEAQTGLDYARRKQNLARSNANLTARAGMMVAPLAPIVPSGGPNPFQPIPIGPTIPGDLDQARQTQTPQQSRAHRPPVVNADIPVVGTSNADTPTPGIGPVPFSPLDDVPGAATGTPTGTGAAPADPPARTEGEITIWVSEPDEPATGGAAAPAPTTSGHAARADGLRSQGDELRATGQSAAAATAYGGAIEAYQAHSAADPAAGDANKAAIQACERARGLCETSQGQ